MCKVADGLIACLYYINSNYWVVKRLLANPFVFLTAGN